MVVTILAIASILLLGFLTVLGYKAVIRGSGTPPLPDAGEKCAICRVTSPKAEMVIRQIGDYKLLYFCRKCIVGLGTEIGMEPRDPSGRPTPG